MKSQKPKKHPDILIRDVPVKVGAWINEQRKVGLRSQKEVVLSVLENACVRESEAPPYLPLQFPVKPVQATPTGLPFKFIDLFAGIGGLRLGLEKVGGQCVFSSEWDEHCKKTYNAWFGEIPHGDIRKVNTADIPDHDLLAAGFPCQPFSIAGVSKKISLGREHGFKDKTQGTLFFHVAEIIEKKRPPVVLLENVKNLLSHDKGNTWRVIHSTLSELNYSVHHQIIDAEDYVPQHRERVFIVCLDKKIFGKEPEFRFPEPPEKKKPLLRDILENNPDPKYTLSDKLWNYLQRYAEKHRALGNGFGFGLTSPDSRTRTLSARYYKDGSEILIPTGKGKNPRRLTPREAAKLMGFPDKLDIVVSDTQAYKQFGNAVVPLVVEAVGRQIITVMAEKLQNPKNGCLLKTAAH